MAITTSFVIFTMLVSILALSCAKNEPLSEHPTIALSPAAAEFGDISADDPIAFHEVSLTIANKGKEALHIDGIEMPEGFSYNLIPARQIIEGGEKAILRISMDCRRFSAPVSETAYIKSNAPDQPRMPVALTANILKDKFAVVSGSEGPDIEFDHRAFDFGPISRSQMVEHQFPFRNTGQKPLKILGIETMCMCVTAYTTKIEVAPGETAAIVARVEPWKYDGVAPWKTLSIATNDPNEPIVNVSVAGAIVDDAVLEPNVVLLPNIRQGQGAQAQVKLLQRGSQELVIKRIDSSSPKMSATFEPLEGDEIGYLVNIAVSPDMPKGKFEEVITVFTNYSDYSRNAQQGTHGDIYKDYSRMLLPIRGSVSGAVTVSPDRINFGSCAPGVSVKRKLIVSAASGAEVQVSVDDPVFRAVQSLAEPGKYEIVVEFLPQPPEREINAELLITTEDAHLKIPIFAVVKQVS